MGVLAWVTFELGSYLSLGHKEYLPETVSSRFDLGESFDRGECFDLDG